MDGVVFCRGERREWLREEVEGIKIKVNSMIEAIIQPAKPLAVRGALEEYSYSEMTLSEVTDYHDQGGQTHLRLWRNQPESRAEARWRRMIKERML